MEKGVGVKARNRKSKRSMKTSTVVTASCSKLSSPRNAGSDGSVHTRELSPKVSAAHSSEMLLSRRASAMEKDMSNGNLENMSGTGNVDSKAWLKSSKQPDHIEDFQASRLRTLISDDKTRQEELSTDEGSEGTDEEETASDEEEDSDEDNDEKSQQLADDNNQPESAEKSQGHPEEALSKTVHPAAAEPTTLECSGRRPCTYQVNNNSKLRKSSTTITPPPLSPAGNKGERRAETCRSSTSSSDPQQSDDEANEDDDDFQRAPPSTAAYTPPAIFPTPGWFAKFYERYTRPGWDSSPYKPTCNRPAWDHQVYVDARERFLRHETVKAKPPGRHRQLAAYPVSMFSQDQQYLSGMPYPSPLFEAALMQSACFQRPPRPFHIRSRTGVSTSSQSSSKSGTPRLRRSPPRTARRGPSVQASTVSSNAKIVTKPSDSSVNTGPSTNTSSSLKSGRMKTALPNNRPAESVTDDDESHDSRRIIICPAKVVQSKASTKQSDYSSTWKKPSAKKPRSVKGESDTSSQDLDQQRVHVPRVAFLTKPHCRKSRSGNGGYYSQSIVPRNPVYGDQDGEQPRWDPSPFIPVGKKNAWDATMPKTDYYRIRRFGWT